MPIVGDWKKPFTAGLEMVSNSLELTARAVTERLFLNVRNYTLPGNSAPDNKNIFIETPQANVFSKDRVTKKGRKIKGRRIFHNTKFMNRTGNLSDSLTPTGWHGNTMSTKGEGSAVSRKTEDGIEVRIKFGDKASYSLMERKNIPKVTLVDKEGKPTKENAQLRRRPFPREIKTLVNLAEKTLKSFLDKGAKKIS